MSFSTIREELDRIKQSWLLLHFVQDDQTGAVIQPSDRVSGKAQPLVRVVERVVYRLKSGGRGEQVTDKSGLSSLTRSRDDRDRLPQQALQKARKQTSRVQSHAKGTKLARSLQDCNANLQSYCKDQGIDSGVSKAIVTLST